MKKTIFRFVSSLLLLTLLATPAMAKTSIEAAEAEPAGPLTDIFVMRPLGLVMLGVGTALFIPAAGLTAITRPKEIRVPYNILVREPARFVFVDPIASH
jgi:hypothetical protein